MMAAVLALLGAVPVLMLFSPTGPHGVVPRTLSMAISGCCALMCLLWAVKWPTRRQSAAFVVGANLSIAAMCLGDVVPGTGIQGFASFAALAGYVAFFHNSRYLAFTLTIATATTTVRGIEVVAAGDVALSVTNLLVFVTAIFIVPFFVQMLAHNLGHDALNSDTDPLTALLNRRGFNQSVRVLASESSRDGSAHLTLVMVDLDDFKRINDTAGHAAGDRTLIVVSDILRHTRRGDSVVARIGGEEFVVAVAGDRREAIGLAERLRREIAQPPSRITASIGVASASLFRVASREIPAYIDRLAESADRAMYKAKRMGGNRIHVVGRPSEAYVEKPMASNTTATKGNVPWITAARAFSGAETRSTIAAASIDPTPAKTNAAPTRVPPEIMNPTPTTVTTARNRL